MGFLLGSRSSVALSLLLAASVLLGTGSPAQAVTSTAYPTPTQSPNPYPAGIAAGPDASGNLTQVWFIGSGNGTASNPAKIDGFTPAGTYSPATELSLPANGTTVASGDQIISAVDKFDNHRKLYMSVYGDDSIRSYDPQTNTFQRFGLGASPAQLTVGADGNLYFTERLYTDHIERLSLQASGGGTVFDCGQPSSASYIQGLTTGADGKIWFTLFNTNQIGRLDNCDGVPSYTAFNAGATFTSPLHITAGPNNDIWFDGGNANIGQIANITTAPAVNIYPVPYGGTGASTGGIVTGSDGNIYYLASSGQGLLAIKPDGTYISATPGSNAYNDLTAGPPGDPALYYTTNNGPSGITRVVLGPNATASSATAITATTATLNGTVTPQGSATVYHFDYGTDMAFGVGTFSSIPTAGNDAPVGSDGSSHVVSNNVAGLSPNTKYFVRVVATSSANTTPTISATVSFTTSPGPPVNQLLPVVSGSATVGSVLSASSGTWSGASSFTYAYQWRRCDSGGGNCVDIPSAMSSTYQLANAEVGSTIRVRVTATDTVTSNAADSAQSAFVEGVPVNQVLPAISGSATDSSTLTASSGTWGGASSFTYAYQWRRCDSGGGNCVDIPSAMSSTYQLVNADLGSTVRVRVTATDSVTGTAADSTQSAVIGDATPVNAVLPAITGAPTEGNTLTSDTGTWRGSSSFTYAYQWRRCDGAGANCSDILLATANSYVPVAQDVASTLRVRVFASDNAVSAPTASAISAPTAPTQALAVSAPVVASRLSGTTTAGGQALSDPTFGQTANLTPVSGTVLVELPGTSKFIPLSQAKQVSLGTIVDATRGRVTLCTASAPAGAPQCSDFYEGMFEIGQSVGPAKAHAGAKKRKTKKAPAATVDAGPFTDIILRGGDFRACKARRAKSKAKHASTAGRKHVSAGKHASTRSVRHLWGDGHGHFRTIGQVSSATVRGTNWLTDDRCDGTAVSVRRGVVAVTDFRRRKVVLVPAGKSLLVKRR